MPERLDKLDDLTLPPKLTRDLAELYTPRLFVPTEMVQRWVENGLFPIQNPRKIERIMKVIEERDYFREVLSYQKDDFTIPIEKGTRLIK